MYKRQVLNGVDTGILDPRDTYADASQWEEKAKDLASRFIKNFKKYEGNEHGLLLLGSPIILSQNRYPPSVRNVILVFVHRLT